MQVLRINGDNGAAAVHSVNTGVLGPTPFSSLGCVDQAHTFQLDPMHIAANTARDLLNMLMNSPKFNIGLYDSLVQFDLLDELEDQDLNKQPWSWSADITKAVHNWMVETKFPTSWFSDHGNIGELGATSGALKGMKTHTYHVLLQSGLLAELANWQRGKCVRLMGRQVDAWIVRSCLIVKGIILGIHMRIFRLLVVGVRGWFRLPTRILARIMGLYSRKSVYSRDLPYPTALPCVVMHARVRVLSSPLAYPWPRCLGARGTYLFSRDPSMCCFHAFGSCRSP